MKIRNRLSWVISVTAILGIASLSMLVYAFTAQFHEREFFSRLEERVAITERIFLEKNEEIEQAVRDKFIQTLDREKEYAITLNPSGIDSLSKLFSPDLHKKVQRQKMVRFRQGELQGVGVYYELPYGKFVVIVTAIDIFGQTKLDFLRRILLIGGIVIVLLLVIVHRITIRNALKPIENKIVRASRVSVDHLDLRLQVKNPDDEVGQLALAFNHMLDRLQLSFEAQRKFVRNASHEMRNPLTAISGQVEVLLEKLRTPEEYQKTLMIIQRETDRMEVLIRQLLDLEKTEALFQVPEPKSFSMGQCLLETIEMIPSNQIILNFDTEDEDEQFYGNKHLMQTAFQNLIENALKYSDNQPVTVCFSHEKNNFLIRIIDQGIGIPAEDINKIFQPFFRSANARRRAGHGVGLAIVHHIIALHKGIVTFISKEGEGTTVNVKLPYNNV